MVATINASTPASAQTVASGSGEALVDEFKKYIGHRYKFGGYYYNPAGWDCSSAISWVLQKCGITPPGGHYDGREHGPVVASYGVWSGAKTIPRSQMQAGDLCIYGTDHIAMVTKPGWGISAEDPADGTKEAPLSAGPGPYIIRRIRSVAASTGGSTSSGGLSLNPVTDVENLIKNSLPNLMGDLINGIVGPLDSNGLADFIERAFLIGIGLVFVIIGIVKVASN